ncbi:UPF0261-domain-containing protein [Clavulina sp. PMI_390]|nr:UPF0261-domain-containing protein [Clavulina sp. PMI_390]
MSSSSSSLQNPLCGVMGLGGSTTSAVVSSIMRDGAAIGLPKLIVSTMASGDVSGYVGDSDITIMPSIVDISGRLNDISERMLRNAAAAMAGMAHEYYSNLSATGSSEGKKESKGKRIAITMFGLTTPGVNAAMEKLATYKDANGDPMYNPVVFHATGAGGRSMERLIREGWFDGVLDLTTTELADNLAGGVLSAGPTRLTAASSVSIPQVISLGALDMVNFGSPDSIPEQYKNASPSRVFHEHNSSVTLMRTNVDECAKLGQELAEKLRAGGEAMSRKTAVVIPLGGWSGIDLPGEKFHDPEADARLVSQLKEGLVGSDIQVEEVQGSINDAATSEKAVQLLHNLLSV